MKRWLITSTLLLGLAHGALQAQPIPGQAHTPRPDTARLDYDLKPRAIAPGVWVFEGAVDDFSRANGCNIINTALITTGAGAIVVNTGPSRLYGVQQRQVVQQLTNEPVVQVLNLNLHPDYFFGNQAWQGMSLQALPGSITGMKAEGPAYADNLYRLCGDWMKGTESTPATAPAEPRRWRIGQRELELRRLEGHTDDDLVLIDHTARILYAGGLVFADRAPTTPHAHFDRWIASLEQIRQWHQRGEFVMVVPSHGPVHAGLKGIDQTLSWLKWTRDYMQSRSASGLDLTEVLAEPLPSGFRNWAAQPQEWHRTLTQWYPVYEKRMLQPAPTR